MVKPLLLAGGGVSGKPVTVTLAETCPEILGDAQQLRQVIHNLLQNAQDATLARLHAGEQDGQKAQVSISTEYNADSRRVRMTVRGNQITDVTPLSGPKDYHRLVTQAARRFKCQASGTDEVQVTFEVSVRED